MMCNGDLQIDGVDKKGDAVLVYLKSKYTSEYLSLTPHNVQVT